MGNRNRIKTAYARGGGGIASLELREVDTPVPGPGEALVRLTAATLNYRDLLLVRGVLPGMAKEPDFVPLSCGAGQVVAVGEGVTRVAPLDRVQPIFAPEWLSGPRPTGTMLGGSADGTARQFGMFTAESLCRLPDMLGDLDAATLPCAGLTAWNALFQHRQLQPGEWVLCPGTGGVSIAALQLAKAAGAKVAITSSSDAKLNRARALGADVTVNYRTSPDWVAEVRAGIGGNEIAVLIDVVGATEVEASAALIKPGGLIAAIGLLGSQFTGERAEVAGRAVGRIGVGNREQHETMLAFIAEHAIRPVVDAVYDLDSIADAYRHLESGRFFGKIAISLL